MTRVTPHASSRHRMTSTDNLPPKRIGYVIPEFPGQTHIWMWRELQHLRERGLDVSLISTRRPGNRDRARHAWADDAAASTRYLWPTPPAPLAAAVAWAALRRPAGWLRAVRTAASLPLEAGPRRALALLAPAAVLARGVVRDRIDHLHAHTCGDAAVICLLAGRITGTPYSLTLNADIDWWGEAMSEKFGGAAFTVAITRWLLDELRRDYPQLRPDQTLLGRIGVDTRRWTPAEVPVETPACDNAGTLRLLTLGRLHAIKGHDVLLRAVAALAGEGCDVTLRLAGDGPERAALEALASDLGVANRVTFLGSVSEDEALRQMRGQRRLCPGQQPRAAGRGLHGGDERCSPDRRHRDRRRGGDHRRRRDRPARAARRSRRPGPRPAPPRRRPADATTPGRGRPAVDRTAVRQPPRCGHPLRTPA